MPARMFYGLGAEKERLASEPAERVWGLLMAYCCGSGCTILAAAWYPRRRAKQRDFNGCLAIPDIALEIHREAELTYADATSRAVGHLFFSGLDRRSLWRRLASVAPGVDGMEVADSVMSPIPGHELYICGEAYSPYNQSWAEGAVERAKT